jgi:hypothetical protein
MDISKQLLKTIYEYSKADDVKHMLCQGNNVRSRQRCVANCRDSPSPEKMCAGSVFHTHMA